MQRDPPDNARRQIDQTAQAMTVFHNNGRAENAVNADRRKSLRLLILWVADDK